MNVRRFLFALKEMGIEEVLIERKDQITLEDLAKKVKECKRCELHKTRRHTVFGEGNPFARLLIIGEAPGEEEDKEGRPFVGRAGRLLDQMIEAVGLKREHLYICNLLKCRPPENRDPKEEEIESCKGYLFAQIDLIKPKIILTLGRFAFNTLFGGDEKITRIRGIVREYRGIKVIPTYHPSFLLRNEKRIEEALSDLKKAKDILKAYENWN